MYLIIFYAQLSLNFFKPGKTIEIIKLLHEHCKNPEMLSIPLMDVVNLGSLELLKQMVELRMVKVPIIPKGRLSIGMYISTRRAHRS